MKIKKGENRIVVLLPALKLALKFPRIRLWQALKKIYRIIQSPKDWRHYLGETVHHFSIKRCLFKGIVDNWSERRFYHRTGHPFLQPTYFRRSACSIFSASGSR